MSNVFPGVFDFEVAEAGKEGRYYWSSDLGTPVWTNGHGVTYEEAPRPAVEPAGKATLEPMMKGLDLDKFRDRLRNQRYLRIGGVAAGVAVGIIAIFTTSNSDKHAGTARAVPPATSPAPESTPTTVNPAKSDTYRYDYRGSAIVCVVPAQKHKVVAGDTLYDIAQASSPAARDYDMDWLLPTIDKLNIERGLVKDPDKLQPGDDVDTIQNCKMYDWYPGNEYHDGSVYVRDIDHHATASYEYDAATDKWGRITYCYGDDAYCESLGYHLKTTTTTRGYGE